MSCQKAQDEVRARRRGGATRGLARSLDLQEDDARVVKEDAAGRRQLDATRRTGHQAAAQLGLEVAHLPAERGLGGVEALLGGDVKAADLGHGDEVAEVTQVQGDASKVSLSADQVLFGRADAV